MSSRSSNSKHYISLTKRLKKLKDNEIQERIDLTLEFAEYYRKINDTDAAIAEYSKAEALALKYNLQFDASFACRGLCEIYAETNCRRDALKYCEKFRNAAAASKNVSQIQLSYHVTGWVLQQLWVQDHARPKPLLEDALRYVKKSINYIKENSPSINADSKAVASGGDANKRKAHAERLYAGIAGCLGYEKEAVLAWSRAYHYAEKKRDSELKYELLYARIDFKWENKHVEMAQRLLNSAPEKKKGSALLELSQAYIFEFDFSSAQKVLYDCLNKHYNNIPPNDQEVLNRRIVFLYKFFNWQKSIDDPCVSRKDRRKCFERIADSLIDFSDDRKTLHRIALEYYKKMFDCSITIEEKMPAVMSLAETHKDTGNYSEAAHFFKMYLKMEESRGCPESKLLETKGAIFICNCLGHLESELSLRKEYEALSGAINEKQNFLKISINKHYGSYLRDTTGAVSNECLQIAEKLESLPNSQTSSTDSDDEDTDKDDDEGELKEYEIIQQCRRNALQMNNKEELIRMKDKVVNSYGETNLHCAARNTNKLLLDDLIAYGYDVNFQDYGGWTPLHEAVSYGIRENVLRLLKAKAKVNVRSKEPLEDDSTRVGGGITPLMDACQSGFVQIANDILRFGADFTLKNTDGWTALDFLRASIPDCDEEDDIVERTKFVQDLENRFRERGVAFSREPPTKKRRSITGGPRKTSNRQQIANLSPSKANLNVYKSTMGMFSKSSRKRSGDEVALFDECDIENLDSPVMESPTFKGSPDCSPSMDMYGSRRRSSFPNPNISVHEEFIDDLDTSRKRKTAPLDRLYKKSRITRSASSTSMQGVVELDCGFASSPDSFIHFHSSPQFSDEMPLRGERNHSFTQRSAAKVLNLSNHSTPTAQRYPQATCIATVTSKNPDGSTHWKKKMKFGLTDKVSDIALRCKEILPEYQHNFIIKSSDGCELEDDIRVEDINPPEFDCQLQLLTTEMLLKSKGVNEPEILNQLKEFDVSDSLDISSLEISSFGDKLFEAIRESSRRIKSLNIEYCGSKTLNERLSPTISPELEVFRASASCVSAELLQTLSQENLVGNLKLVALPFTKITDGTIIANFLSSSKLTSIDISGLELQSGVANLVEALKNATNLKFLDISYSSWLTLDTLNSLIQGIVGLEELIMNGNNISYFHFDLPHLPKMKRLCMSGCSFENWDSLLEWLEYSDLEFIDLSSTNLSLQHVDTLISSRTESSQQISIRAVRCLLIEDVPKLSNTLLNHINCSFKPLFQFSNLVQTKLRKISVFADSFLVSMKSS